MKKGKIFLGILVLLTTTIIAIAFKTSHTPPVHLYYFNGDGACVVAPCDTINHTNKACLVTVYTDSNCSVEYKGGIWSKNSDQ